MKKPYGAFDDEIEGVMRESQKSKKSIHDQLNIVIDNKLQKGAASKNHNRK